jgi:hypothetical protein
MQVVEIEGGRPWRVVDLIEELSKVANKEQQVWMSKDEEGNGFAPLSGFGEGRVNPPKWGWTDDMYERTDTDGVLPVLVLWPNA